MSLINQVLKDIDKRQANKNVSYTLDESIRGVGGTASQSLSAPLMIIIVLALIGLGVYFFRAALFPTAPVVPAPALVQATPLLLQQPAAPALAPGLTQQSAAAVAQPQTQAQAPAQAPAKALTTSAQDNTAAPSATATPNTGAQVNASQTNSAANTPAPMSKEVRVVAAPRAASSAPAAGPAPAPVVTKTPTPEQRSVDLARQAQPLLRQNQAKQAQPLLEQALSIYPGNIEARQLLAHTHLQLNDVNAAITTLKGGLTPNGNSPDYNAFLGALLQRKERHEEAVQQYVAALQRSPDNANWLVGIAISLQAQNMMVSAKEAYQRALDLGTLPPDLAGFAQRRLSQINR